MQSRKKNDKTTDNIFELVSGCIEFGAAGNDPKNFERRRHYVQCKTNMYTYS